MLVCIAVLLSAHRFNELWGEFARRVGNASREQCLSDLDTLPRRRIECDGSAEQLETQNRCLSSEGASGKLKRFRLSFAFSFAGSVQKMVTKRSLNWSPGLVLASF